jgi:glycosyltransferase involved in cell wall biosynthesis
MGKKILIVYAKSTSELANRQSALGSYIYCFCDILQNNGMTIFVNGIEFNLLKHQPPSSNAPRQTGITRLKRLIPSVIKELIKDLQILKKIKRTGDEIISAEQYDGVLEFYTYASDIGYRVSSRQKIPLLLIYDSPVLEEYIFFYGNKWFFKKLILKRELTTLLKSKSITVYSTAVKTYLNKLSGKDLNISIHQNVDFTRFDFIEKQFNSLPIKIGFIGSFLKWHRIDLLIRAFEKLRKEHYQAELFLVGYGMEYDSIKLVVDQSPYKAYITLTGFMDGKPLLEIKKMLHIGVMPGSNWYGAPNKIFEYGAAKMAVVAPDTPTIVDLFEDKKELLLFKQDDADQLYDKLKMLCDDVTVTEQLAETLQQKIKNKYSEKITLDFYNGLFMHTLT